VPTLNPRCLHDVVGPVRLLDHGGPRVALRLILMEARLNLSRFLIITRWLIFSLILARGYRSAPSEN
jgi:hypothetical protein